MLQVRNLTKKFGSITAVNKISFEAKVGEVVGFLGPNGAGKTTTMRLVTGFLTPNEGKITISGLPPREAHHLVGYLPEDNPLYYQFTPLEYLRFIGEMNRLSQTRLEKRLDYVIRNFNIGQVLSQTIETLSRGFRQRVGLAATLIHDPKLVLMDEPTNGLDPNQQLEIRKIIKKLAKDKAVILSTHFLAEAKSVCDRVIIIHHGNIAAEEKLTNLKQKRQSLVKLFSKLTKE
ncbi:MAG: ABC transporter ATP-binding protein [Patescibacteria group bacterium]|nr:ABC transporter ATP-binding protein [Patescibacteria group bacterium]